MQQLPPSAYREIFKHTRFVEVMSLGERQRTLHNSLIYLFFTILFINNLFIFSYIKKADREQRHTNEEVTFSEQHTTEKNAQVNDCQSVH